MEKRCKGQTPSGLGSVAHFVSRRVLGALAALVIQPRRADIVVSEPELHLRNVRAMFQGIGRGRGAQAVHAHANDLDAGRLGPVIHHHINAISGEPAAGGPAAERAKQPLVSRFTFGVQLQVLVDPLGGDRMQRQVAHLAAFAARGGA